MSTDPNSPSNPSHGQRRIRSFVRREGKLTSGQDKALNEVWPLVGVPLDAQLIEFDQLFKRTAPVVLEIGFGNGLSLAHMAEQHPELNFFGIEVHRPGVGSLLVQVKKLGLENVRVSQDDAVEVFKQQVPPDSLSRLQIFFPDPWHKKRHHKRRLINTEFINLAVSRLKGGGTLHVATDWENYAEQILEVLSACPLLANTAENYAPKPDYRPSTKYEERGIRFGHEVFDLVFKKSL